MADVPRYKFQPLPAPEYIRLLYLLPRQDPLDPNDVIRCELLTVSVFGQVNDYKAVSYMWGRRDADKDILIRSTDSPDSSYSSFRITENLWTCLRKLSDDITKSQCGSSLWIDAICINQADDAERSSQVAQMGKIYSSAGEVIIWPRDPASSPNSNNTSALLEFLDKIVKHQPEEVTFDTHLLTYYQDAECDDMWTRLGEFCTLEYWSRVWIVQETILATRLAIHCENKDRLRTSSVGQHGLEWENFVRVCEGLANLPVEWPLLDSVPIIRNSVPLRIASLRASGGYGSLRDLLATFEDSRCTEARDKIYGLLSLTYVSGQSIYNVDYSLTMFEVFASVVQTESSRTSSSVFGICAFSQLVQRTLGGPFPTLPSSIKLGNERGPDSTRLLSIGGYLVDRIVPIEPVRRKSTDAAHIRRKRLEALRACCRSPASSMSDFDRYLASCLSQLESIPPPCLGHLHSNSSFASENQLSRLLESDPQLPFEPQHQQPDCYHRLFLSTNGLVGFGPSCTREDDILCHFVDSDVAAIVRPISNAGIYQIIGRAAICKEFSEKVTKSRLHRLSPYVFKFRAPRVGNHKQIIYFHVDAATLQRLTCPF